MPNFLEGLNTETRLRNAHELRHEELKELQIERNRVEEDYKRDKENTTPEQARKVEVKLKQINEDMTRLRGEMAEIDIKMELIKNETTLKGNVLEVGKRGSDFLETKEAEEVFAKVVQNSRSAKLFRENWEKVLEERGVSFEGGVPIPKSISDAITDAFEESGLILSLVKKDWGNESKVYLVETGKALGYGDNRADKENDEKEESDLNFKKVEVNCQFIYEFFDVKREDLKNVASLLGYIKTTLPKRLAMTQERAILIKTGTISDATYIKSIQPISGAPVDFVEEITISELDEDTVDVMASKIKAKGQKFLIGSSDDYLALRKIRDISGRRAYDFGTTVVNGVTLKTVNGHPYIEVDYISSTEDAVVGNYSLVMAVLSKYTLTGEGNIVFYQDMTNKKNVETYMVEQYMGGAPTELKMASVIKKGTPTGTLSANVTKKDKQLINNAKAVLEENEALKKELEAARKELEVTKDPEEK